jgi:hypothetical protein
VTSTTANFAILDTSVYIDNLRSGRFKQEILDLKFVVRLSAVVLAELSMGARSIEMKRLVDDLAKTPASSLRTKEAGFSRAASSAGLSLPKGSIFTKPERFISTCSSRSVRDELALIW